MEAPVTKKVIINPYSYNEMQKKNHDIFEENWKSWFIILVETAFNPFSYLTQVSPEILTQAKNEAKSPN